MKRVALVSYHCPPVLNAESILVWKTLRELSKHHQVTVLTTEPGYQRIDPVLEIPPGIQVVRAKEPQFRQPFWNRAVNKAVGWVADEKILWAMSAARRFSTPTFDVLYSRSQPGASHIVALRLKQTLGVPWIAQFSDPWASNPYHANHTKLRAWQDARVESQVVRTADWLVFPTIELQHIYAAQYPNVDIATKSRVLPHHTSADLYEKQSALLKLEPDCINLAYFGDFYGERSPEPLIQACQQLCQRRSDLARRLVLHFIGNIEAKFVPLLKHCPMRIVTGKMGYFESLNAMTKADGLILLDAPNPEGKTPFLPSKLIDYLGARRPILGITELVGTAPDILRSYGYPVIRPVDVAGIAEQLETWVDGKPMPSMQSIESFSTATVIGYLAELLSL